MEGNASSRIIIVNTKNSNIGSIEDDTTYRNELYKLLYKKYNLDIKNIPIYYIWDRDNCSNDSKMTKKLLSKLTSPYENEEFENGLLLLSYPCCESYTISNFEKNRIYLDYNIKDYVKDNKYRINLIDRFKIQRAVLEMIKNLEKLDIHDFDIDKIGKINMKTFCNEEQEFKNRNNYILLSFISVIFLDLGIITFREE